MSAWPVDVKVVLRFENNIIDIDIGLYEWINSGGVPFSDTIFYADLYSAGPFTGAQNINTSVDNIIKTIDFWAYVPTGSAIGTIYSCDFRGIRLYFNDGKIYLNHNSVGQIGGFSVPLDTWFRLQITNDLQFETVYLNGAEMCQQLTNKYPTKGQKIGNSFLNDDPFDGYVDQFKMSIKNYQGAEILYIPELTLLTCTPDSGSEDGGTFITITGLLFDGVTAVYIGGNLATDFKVVDSTHITCVTPAGTAGAVDVGVYIDPTYSATLTGGFLYVFIPVIPPELASAEMIIEKANYVLSATITPISAVVQDGKHTHFDIDTGVAAYKTLLAGQSIVIDFGAAKTIKKITLFLYPKKFSYFINELSFNNAVAKIEWYDGANWQNLTWQSFNEYYGLPTATLYYTASYYASTVGLISVWDRTGVSAYKLRVTAPGVNIALTEVEACDLIIAEPTNIRVNEIASALGEYQGIRVSGTFIDLDFGIYDNVFYRKNAFLKAIFKEQLKYFGLLAVDGNSVDEQNRLTYIELVNIYDKLAAVKLNKNAAIGTQDYAQVIEWLFACADIYRDLYDISVVISNFNYIPENTDVQSDLAAVLESGGDIQLLCQDGVMAVKSRRAETPETAAISINTYWDTWLPQFRFLSTRAATDYFNANIPKFLNMFAPIFGFSLSETFENSRAAWGNGWLMDTGALANFTFEAAPELSTVTDDFENNNYYKLRLITPSVGNAGYWKMRGNVKTTVITGVYYKHTSIFVGQYIAAKGQGAVNITASLSNSDTDRPFNYSDTTTLNTASAALRVAYYLWSDNPTAIIGPVNVGKIIFNQTTGAIVSRNDFYDTIKETLYPTVPLDRGLEYFSTVDFKVSSYNSAGASAEIEAIGVQGVHRRSIVFSAPTPDAITFIGLSVPSDNPCTVFTLTNDDIEPVLSVSGSCHNAAGDKIDVFVLPPTLSMTNFNIASGGYNIFPAAFSTGWTTVSLTGNITVVYTKIASADIENGTIQLYSRDLKYRKGARNVDEDIVVNRLQIKINKYTASATAEQIYNDEIPFVINTTAHSFINQNAALDLSKTINLYIKVIVSEVTYEYNYSPGTYYNTDMDCDIIFEAFVLGCSVSITPRSTAFNRGVQIVTITAFPFGNSGQITDIKDFSTSQRDYGIIEKNIDNSKVNTTEQSLLIQKKYERFLTLPVVFLGDGMLCDLNLAVDFAKYILIDDEIRTTITTYKINEYEMVLDITNNDYQMTIKGRAQSYDNY
jgi:hypothetical protein